MYSICQKSKLHIQSTNALKHKMLKSLKLISYSFIYAYSVARGRAQKLLNYRKPEHPPDIYFIRRKPELLDKYLD